MYKLILIVGIFISTIVRADWDTLTGAPVDGNGLIFYSVDWSTLRKEAKSRKIWMMIDRKAVSAGDIASMKVYYEFSCEATRFRALQATFFSENNGKGSILDKIGIQDWEYSAPETSMNTVLKRVCSR